MTENSGQSQLLKDAFINEGSLEQAALLTGETGQLTKDDIINFINGIDLEKLTTEGKALLNRIARMRIKNGQPVFPWGDEEFTGRIQDSIVPTDGDPLIW